MGGICSDTKEKMRLLRIAVTKETTIEKQEKSLNNYLDSVLNKTNGVRTKSELKKIKLLYYKKN